MGQVSLAHHTPIRAGKSIARGLGSQLPTVIPTHRVGCVSFNLSNVFHTVATTIPDQRVVVWRDKRLTYAQMDDRIDGIAHYLTAQGLGCHTERDQLAGHQCGQDTMGLYLRNGNEYLEAMVAGYRARVAPFNVNYRYVEEELLYLLSDAKARALVYAAEFAPHVQSIRGRLPELRVLIQVADDSGNDLLPEAVDYESLVDTRGTGDGNARAQRRRPLRPLHRRHHRHAQRRAVAPARHLHVGDGRTPVHGR